MLPSKTVLYVKIVSINNVWNVKLVKVMRIKDVLFLGELVIMHIILIVLLNGLIRRKLSVRYVRVYGILSRLQNSERND